LISFTGFATGGLEPYSYYWDFGNGDFSEEQNPEYAYDETGIYDLILTVADSQGLKEVAVDETTATIESPGELEIGEITGALLRVNAEIKNIDDNEATDVEWSISVNGGILGLINVSVSNIFDSIGPNSSEIVYASPIFGIGKIDITVIASAYCLDPIEKKATGLVIGPFILGISES